MLIYSVWLPRWIVKEVSCNSFPFALIQSDDDVRRTAAYFTVLYCIFCTVLCCTVLYYILYCSVLYCTALYCSFSDAVRGHPRPASSKWFDLTSQNTPLSGVFPGCNIVHCWHPGPGFCSIVPAYNFLSPGSIWWPLNLWVFLKRIPHLGPLDHTFICSLTLVTEIISFGDLVKHRYSWKRVLPLYNRPFFLYSVYLLWRLLHLVHSFHRFQFRLFNNLSKHRYSWKGNLTMQWTIPS
jgi:hypothetical protein